MKERLKNRLRELTSIIGISGYEWDVARYIKKELEGHVDSIEMMSCGHLVARKKGNKPGPRVMVHAHMDEVGYQVQSISSDGFLFFNPVGGSSLAAMPARRVWVKGYDAEPVLGLIGTRSAHIMTEEDKKKPQSVRQSYIDVGAKSREEVEAMGITTGAQVVIDSPLVEMNNPDLITGRAIDDRAGCAIILEALKDLKADDIHGEIIAVFGALEEVTVSAASAVVNRFKPEYGLFIDTIPAGDVPDVNFDIELPIGVDMGPVLVHTQQTVGKLVYAATHPKLLEALRQSAISTESKYQEYAFIGASYVTEGANCLYAGDGMAISALAIPRRYSHSPAEHSSINDIVDTFNITMDFLKKEIDITMI